MWLYNDGGQDGVDVEDNRKLVLNISDSENDFAVAAENGVEASINFVREKRMAVVVSIIAVAFSVMGLMAAFGRGLVLADGRLKAE